MATVVKRIRLTQNVINKTTGAKQARYEHKLAFLEDVPKYKSFQKHQQRGVSGY